MLKSNIVVIALVLSLAACAMPPGAPMAAQPSKPAEPQKSRDVKPESYYLGFDFALFPLTDPCEVMVKIAAQDQIIPVPYVIDTFRCRVGGKTHLTWRLDARTAPNYTFPFANAIGFNYKGGSMPTSPGCAPSGASGKVIECTFDTPTASGSLYFYSITVLKNGVALPVLDPLIFNN